LQRILGMHAGRAWGSRGGDPEHVQADPEVWLVNEWGGKVRIGEVRLDFAPLTLVEADTDTRHPVVEIFPVFDEAAVPVSGGEPPEPRCPNPFCENGWVPSEGASCLHRNCPHAGKPRASERFTPEGDEQCGEPKDACKCMKRRGHDGDHRCAHGTWLAGPLHEPREEQP